MTHDTMLAGPHTDDSAQRQRIRDLLSKVPLFDGLPVEVLGPIVRGTSRVHAERGEEVVQRGAPCVGFHIIVYGQVKLVYRTSSGEERVIRLMGAGESFGEALMFMEHTHIVSAVAVCDTLLLYVRREALFERLDRDPQLARKLLASMGRQLYMLMGDLSAYTMRTGLQRVIGYLLRVTDVAEGEPFRVEASKGVIASRLNLTPEHFSRILRELTDKELIRVRGREFTILDVQGLRDYHG